MDEFFIESPKALVRYRTPNQDQPLLQKGSSKVAPYWLQLHLEFIVGSGATRAELKYQPRVGAFHSFDSSGIWNVEVSDTTHAQIDFNCDGDADVTILGIWRRSSSER